MYDINYITNTVIKGDCQTELEKIENESIDCFAGGGSSLKAALKNNRRFIGIEIDEEYYNICKENIKEIEEEKKEEQYTLAL